MPRIGSEFVHDLEKNSVNPAIARPRINSAVPDQEASKSLEISLCKNSSAINVSIATCGRLKTFTVLGEGAVYHHF